MLETGLSGDHHISWAPDGKRITFDAAWNGTPNIFTISLDDGKPKRLSKVGTVDFDPCWSPDGSRIAFCSYRDGNNLSVYAMDADGSNEIRLTTGPEDRKPAWSPDGSRIAYWSRVDKDWYICVMKANGSEQTRLIKGGDENGFWGFVWSLK